MIRISMSMPKKLLREFDEVLKNKGYNSRSKGIRDALKDYIARYQWMNEMEGMRVGILTVTYNYHYNELMEDLNDIQHDFMEYIKAVMHQHITENICLDIIIVQGDVEYIRAFTEKIQRLKGVEHVKLTTTVTD